MPIPESRFPVLASFRDPSGFLFERDGRIFRQVNKVYQGHFDHLTRCGLYESLVSAGKLVPHTQSDVPAADSRLAYKVIKPETIPFVSYPCEWCFSQLRQAALTTLQIQKMALKEGMTLKDASACNIQFLNAKPLLIDTLSFEIYRPGEPWAAYRQFCRHFLAPLALMSCVDVRLNQLSRTYLDGIPLDLASSLLPLWSRLRPALFFHLYSHSKFQKHYEAAAVGQRSCRLSRLALEALIDNLESAVAGMKLRSRRSHWLRYYSDTGYPHCMITAKQALVSEFLQRYNPRFIYDIGSNTGVFSRIAGRLNIPVVSFDNDHAVVEENYRACCEEKLSSVLPLVIDVANPSPAAGWALEERSSFFERGPADAVMALALIHHLAFTCGIPLGKIAYLLQKICRCALVEFIPKSDPSVRRLLVNREDIFTEYSRESFEEEFGRYFEIEGCRQVPGSSRSVYFLKRKQR
ncbi:MAG: SAM-dependent methyltransferase [Candidatus Omnitrophota bacterium]